MTTDFDFPFEPRIITPEEFDSFPEHGQPEEVEPLGLLSQLELDHPAFAVREEYRARGEKVD